MQTTRANMTHTLALLTLGFTLSAWSALAVPPVTNYEYDANGNLTKITDGLGNATIQQYDALNRLTKQQQPNPASAGQLGEINMQYNAIDQITGVTDPRNLTTSYDYNAFGHILNLSSPDTGTTTNTYDAAGNVLTKLDAKGQLTTYSYDALNRLTHITYADSQTIAYTYDQGQNGAGRLTSITDSTGTTAYTYNNRGRVTTEARTIHAVTYTTIYAYNAAGQLTGVTYPTGLVLTYARDSLGRVSQISSTINSQTQILAANIAYQPFGGIKSFTFGNGSNYTRSYDADYRLTSYTLGSKTINLDYDLASRIVAATDAANATNSKTYAYDNLDRLTTFVAPSSNQSYGYDLTGNRTSRTVGASTYSNTIAATSNRLTAMSGPTVKANTFDNNGSMTADTINQYTYDARGRLTQADTPLSTASYGINALGQRVIKTLNGTITVYHYDLNGQQIAETDSQGSIKQETIYLGNTPLAVIQ
ncbi:MAG: hypothetical protein WAT12_16740 [Candidatus Nitrotoga sp.]